MHGRVVCVVCTAVQVIHALPEREEVRGIASLFHQLLVLRDRPRYQVELYEINTYCFLRCLHVPDVEAMTDMTACEHYRCAYISDPFAKCIHRLDYQGASTGWAVNDRPACLSVNAAHNVLVTCHLTSKIKEFSTHGQLIRELTLPGSVVSPWHAIQTGDGQFIVCHGVPDDAVHRVCKISIDGRDIVQSHGGHQGTGVGQYCGSRHLAVDTDESVFVVDAFNWRVKLLSPTLDYALQVVSRYQQLLKGWPWRVYLDTQRRRLYVADSTACTGRVIVFNV